MSDPVTTGPCATAHGFSQADLAVHDWRAALERLRGAYADTGIDGYAKDFRLFETWCGANGFCALPTTPRTVASYLDHSIQTVSSATLVRRVAAVTRVHRVLDLPNPADSEVVRIALRRIKRYRPSRPIQALGITRKIAYSNAGVLR